MLKAILKLKNNSTQVLWANKKWNGNLIEESETNWIYSQNVGKHKFIKKTCNYDLVNHLSLTEFLTTYIMNTVHIDIINKMVIHLFISKDIGSTETIQYLRVFSWNKLIFTTNKNKERKINKPHYIWHKKLLQYYSKWKYAVSTYWNSTCLRKS